MAVDSSDLPNDCAPYAIHIATGVDYADVIMAAKESGWSPENGMNEVAAWLLLKKLGVDISQMISPERRMTIGTLLPLLDSKKTYIVIVKVHWFAVKNGTVFDQAKTSLRSIVLRTIEFL